MQLDRSERAKYGNAKYFCPNCGTRWKAVAEDAEAVEYECGGSIVGESGRLEWADQCPNEATVR